MPTQSQNLATWNEQHGWEGDGNEFHQFATNRGQDYEMWKESLIKTFIQPHINPEHTVLEIGCGRGRWSEHFVKRVAKLWLVDLSPTCIEACQAKFGDAASYIETGGDLSDIPDESVDFVWSFDVLVHVDAKDILAYLRQLRRVMKPESLAILHHADDPRHGGWRAQDMSAAQMRRMVEQTDLATLFQTDSWGPNRKYSVKVHQDIISFVSPATTQRCRKSYWA
jgi:ubiquinone/menaquinone biosynthesis C-methylase UbiE